MIFGHIAVFICYCIGNSYAIKSSAKDAHSRARKMLLPQPRSARESACGLFVLIYGRTDNESEFELIKF